MDDYLLELGASDIKLRLDGSWMSLFRRTRAKELMHLILEVETFIGKVERKGIPFREFLEARNAKVITHASRCTLADGTRFAYSIEELHAVEAFRRRRTAQTPRRNASLNSY